MNWDYDWISTRAKLTPEKVAVIDGLSNQSWTYEQLNKRISNLTSLLKRMGVTKGDRVALLSLNHIAYIDLIFACKRIGALFVPLNWRLSLHEQRYIIQDCSPKLLLYHADFEALATQLQVVRLCITIATYESEVQQETSCIDDEGAVQYAMDQPWMIIYTGGTTGKSKGVVLSNRSVYTNSINTILSWNLSADDITLTVLPMFHTGGLNALTLPLLHMGGTIILYPEFDKEEVQRLIQDYGCTIVLMVPTMYHDVIHTDSFKQRSFPSMQVFLSGGAPCPQIIYQAFQEKNIPFKEGYGLTEAGPNNFYITPGLAQQKKGSVGKPMMYNEIKLLDAQYKEVAPGEIGELAIYGEHLFEYYWNNELETTRAKHQGWLLTGDLARRDQAGDFYIMGRKKDMIITGGENVYPQEIEQVLYEHPAVKEVVIIGLPDQKWGEVVTAVISLHSGHLIEQDELQAYCSKRLARYKVPKRFIIAEDIPKTHVGKFNKQLLIQRYLTG